MPLGFLLFAPASTVPIWRAAARLQRQILAWTGGRLRMDVILFTVGMGIFGCTEEGEGLRAFRLSQRGERP